MTRVNKKWVRTPELHLLIGLELDFVRRGYQHFQAKRLPESVGGISRDRHTWLQNEFPLNGEYSIFSIGSFTDS